MADDFVATYLSTHPDSELIKRNFAIDPIPHLDDLIFGAFVTPADQRSEEQQARVNLSDQLIKEVKQADIIVIGLPMYNFGIPSTLKAYFDHIARAGETFRYTETGPAGLVEDKPVYILAARGGIYAGTDKDTQTRYIRDFLALLGITDVHFVYAEGLAMGDESVKQAFAAAEAKIRKLAA
jgi:FMN-dependent NADH-azoreductase